MGKCLHSSKVRPHKTKDLVISLSLAVITYDDRVELNFGKEKNEERTSRVSTHHQEGSACRKEITSVLDRSRNESVSPSPVSKGK